MNATLIAINVLSIIATILAVRGSRAVVDAQYDKANRLFVAGNSTNIAVALSTGNVPLLIGQYALRAYTLPMIESKKFKAFAGLLILVVLAIIGINADHLSFNFSWFEFVGTVGAIQGTRRMIAGDYKEMSYWWIAADLIFFFVGLDLKLAGLTYASFMFTYHGALRLRGFEPANWFDKIMMKRIW